MKPTYEESFIPNNPKGLIEKDLGQPSLTRSVRVDDTGFRKVDAYLLDYDHFINILLIILVKITHSVFHVNDKVNHASGKAHERPQAFSKISLF